MILILNTIKYNQPTIQPPSRALWDIDIFIRRDIFRDYVDDSKIQSKCYKNKVVLFLEQSGTDSSHLEIEENPSRSEWLFFQNRHNCFTVLIQMKFRCWCAEI